MPVKDLSKKTYDSFNMRVYPRRQLRGEVEICFSERLKFPKFHMIWDCDAFKTPDVVKGYATYQSVDSLGLDTSGRPCRNCTLESVLLTVFKNDVNKSKEKQVFVTLTSQGNPLDPGQDIFKFPWKEPSESSKRRLLRVAQKCSLTLTQSVFGPVLFGFVAESTAKILAHNLRTVIREDVQELPDTSAIECFWSFLNDNPPELSLSQDFDPWVVSMMI